MSGDRKNLFGFLFLLLGLIAANNLFSQVLKDSTEIEETQKQYIENVSDQLQGEVDITEITGNLEYYKRHPIQINQADFEELQGLGLLSDIQISNLIAHRNKNGRLLSLYELQSVEGFDLKTIEQILPFITIGLIENKKKFSFREMFRHGNNDITLRYQRIIEKQSGYQKVSDSLRNVNPGSYYSGSPDKVYLKYRFNYYNNVKIGLTAEKDAGEDFFKGSNPYGFDFYSGYININNAGILKSLVVGDFSAQFGQGLTLWSGLGFGKGADAVGVKKIAKGITPSNSVYENGFLRGVGFSLGIKNIQISGFYSYKKVDANIGSDTNENQESLVSSLPEDGQHNTLSRIEKERTLGEQVMGGQLGYSAKGLNIGTVAYYTRYSKNIQKEILPYNQFEFSGKSNINTGIYYSYIFRNFNIFGETSMSQNMGWATVNGFMASVNRYLSISVLYRNYQKNYQSIYSSAFSQSSHTYNEEGLYYGMVIKPHYKLTLSAYADYYRYQWLKYQVNSPSQGYDINAQLLYKPTKKIQIGFRYKIENSMKNTDEEGVVIEYTTPLQRQNYRLQVSYPVSSSISLNTKVEVSQYKKQESDGEWGYYLSQDFRYRNPNSKLAATLRFSVFDTKSYNCRIYTYENDVLYAYSLPALYDKGLRYYVLLQYKIVRNLDIWVRFAQTIYQNKTVVSSGLNEIQGNKQSEIKVQLRYKF